MPEQNPITAPDPRYYAIERARRTGSDAAARFPRLTRELPAGRGGSYCPVFEVDRGVRYL